MIVLIDTVVNLLSEKIEPDELGNQISVLTKKPIFATISSVTQSEYFKAATIALKPQYKIAGVFLLITTMRNMLKLMVASMKYIEHIVMVIIWSYM